MGKHFPENPKFQMPSPTSPATPLFKLTSVKKPLTVAELMLEYSQQVVIDLHSTVTEKRLTPFLAYKKLDMKKIYLMLLVKQGKSVSLLSDEAQHVLLTANLVLRSRSPMSSSKFLSLFARLGLAVAGKGQEIVVQKKEQERAMDQQQVVLEFFPESFDARLEYLNQQLLGKAWKPSLDTIEEKKIE